MHRSKPSPTQSPVPPTPHAYIVIGTGHRHRHRHRLCRRRQVVIVIVVDYIVIGSGVKLIGKRERKVQLKDSKLKTNQIIKPSLMYINLLSGII